MYFAKTSMYLWACLGISGRGIESRFRTAIHLEPAADPTLAMGTTLILPGRQFRRAAIPGVFG